ncbi:MAG: hypothetical protein IPM85_03045 [Chitinophagaceae bacterium]|nr:hypothetical protein [Chitinophagaceae bacterium]
MIRKHPGLLSVLVAAVLLSAISCSKENEDSSNNSLDCSAVINKTFAANISPLIQTKCAIAGCHASGSGNGPGALTSYTEILNAKTAIRGSIASGSMPKTVHLPQIRKTRYYAGLTAAPQ